MVLGLALPYSIVLIYSVNVDPTYKTADYTSKLSSAAHNSNNLSFGSPGNNLTSNPNNNNSSGVGTSRMRSKTMLITDNLTLKQRLQAYCWFYIHLPITLGIIGSVSFFSHILSVSFEFQGFFSKTFH